MSNKDRLKDALDALFVVSAGEKLKTAYFSLYEMLLPYSPLDVKADTSNHVEYVMGGKGFITADLKFRGADMLLELNVLDKGWFFDKWNTIYAIEIGPEMKKKGRFSRKMAPTGDLEAKLSSNFTYSRMHFRFCKVGWDSFFQELSKCYNLHPKYVHDELRNLSTVPNEILNECYRRVFKKKAAEKSVQASVSRFHKDNLRALYKLEDNDAFKKVFGRIGDAIREDVVKTLLKEKSNKELDDWLSGSFPELVERAGRDNYIGPSQ